MLVVILILGLSAGVTVLSVAALKPPPQSALARMLRNARAEAIRTGRAVEVNAVDTVDADGGDDADGDEMSGLIRFLPDGRAIGPGVDPWTGALAQENEGSLE
jgi:hypothetical protein